MQTCSVCKTSSTDEFVICPSCGSDLLKSSEAAVALSELRQNPRVGEIRLMPHEDCCPTCRAAEGVYEDSMVPLVPIAGCSNPAGCRCFYEPILLEMYP